jgi:hypothetical protein
MSKRKDAERQAALAAREAEDRLALFAFDQRMADQAELNRQRNREFLIAAKNVLAQERLEDQATLLTVYRERAIAAAVSNKTLAPQVGAMIPVGLTSREDIDAAVQLGISKTSEIVAEIARRQGEPTVQARDEYGRFIPQGEQLAGDQHLPQGMTAEEYAKAENKSLTMRDYTAMRDRLGIAHRDPGLFG